MRVKYQVLDSQGPLKAFVIPLLVAVIFSSTTPQAPLNSDPGVLSCVCVCVYLLDIALYVEWQVEKELEPLQDVEGVAGGVRFVLPSQHLLEQSVCSVARPYQAEQQTHRERHRQKERERQRQRDTYTQRQTDRETHTER